MEGSKPLYYNALKAYADGGLVNLHMPGHKGGRGFKAPELSAMGRLDYTEVPGLDDWHRPDGPIKEAQQQLADCYGAENSYILVNGATSGIHALLMALGEKTPVIIPRQAHRAFYGGMVLADTTPIYIPSRLDDRWGLPLTIEVQDVALLAAREQAKAVFISSPSYFGTCSNEQELINLAHQAGLPVLYDEAHGAHFGFHPGYPIGALKQGADAVVHGMHKTLPALTGVGCLHLASSLNSWQNRVAASLDLLISTSPSQPLIASADWARYWLSSSEGRADWDEMYYCSQQLDRDLQAIAGIERIQVPGSSQQNDPGRAAIALERLALNGYQLEQILNHEYGIQIEMSGINYIVALFTPFNTKEEWKIFADALADIARRYPGKDNHQRGMLPPPAPMVLLPRAAHFAPRCRVKISEAQGLVSAEMIAAYPPGIPCLLPGEAISSEMIEYLHYLVQVGGRLQGMLDPEAQYIYVIDK